MAENRGLAAERGYADEACLASLSVALLPPIDLPVRASNEANLHALMEMQKTAQQGCFFVGLYAFSNSLFPDRHLSNADEFIAGIRPKYNDLLEEDRLMVKGDSLAEALGIYRDFGFAVTRITRNEKARELFGTGLQGMEALIEDTHKYRMIDISKFKPPFGVIMHLAGSGENETHFITVDGSQDAEDMLMDYQIKGYGVKMVFEVAPLPGEE